MSTMSMPLNCEQFSDRLADYLEEELPEVVRAAMESHADVCASCGALLADLAVLRDHAAALPALEPSRDLWAGIGERIDARVLPLEIPVVRRSAARRAWVRPAVAAAALVLVTAGITEVLTRAKYDPTIAMRSATSTAAARTDTPAAPLQVMSGSQGGVNSSPLTEQPQAPPARGILVSHTRATAARTTSAGKLMEEHAEPVYDREILELRKIARERRSQLDPRTVAVLEQSIAVIDSAIAQSRAALAKDPASGFLATQLNHSLEKKVELLRTAALLPARI
jgi:Putative zinc-finger